MSSKNVFTIQTEKTAVASINGYRCVNCSTCEDYCPVHAISEKQKAICHLCPDCTEMKPFAPDEIIAMQDESCTVVCPLGLSPQGYINLVKAGKEEKAFDLIFSKNPLPAVCGYVCHHPCEDTCKRGKIVDSPMEIRGMKRYLGEKFQNYQPDAYPVTKQEEIAIVGAGPAGLTAAHFLSKQGYQVTVYEENSEPGGMLIRGIPAFRVDKDLVRKDIARLEKAGIKIVCNAKVGVNPKIEELLDDYDRVIIAAGRPVSKRLPIEGHRGRNILTAIDVMARINAGQEVNLKGDGIVLGGGSVALDTARAAMRAGASKVTVVCLESGDAIPAHKWEIDEAKEEGVEFIEGASATRFTGDTAAPDGIDYVKIANLDTSDFSYDVVEGSEQHLSADFVIAAIGMADEREWPDDDRILFAGDVASNQCSVIDAMASGRQAALRIDDDLSGRTYSDYETEREIGKGDLKYKIYPAVRRKLDFKAIDKQKADERVNNFDLVEKSLTDEDALLETYRCLNCGYRYVDPLECIGCGVCQKVCPKGDVITMVAVPEKEETK